MNKTDRQTLGRRDFVKLGMGTSAVASAMGSKALLGQGVPAWEARPANTKSVRPLSIDTHTHWFPEAFVKATVQMGRPAPANPYPLDSDMDQRRKWMDEHGVQMHVLTLSGAMPWQWATPQQGEQLARIVNDAAVEVHMKYPDRFVAAIEIPMRDAGMSLKELNRMAGKPGMRAVHLPNSIEQRDYLFEPEFAPFLKRCEELGYPLLFHPLDGDANIYSKRLAGNPSLTNWLGFTFEHATTAAKFMITGTLDKYPKLEIVLPHGGGAFPFIFARVEHGFYHMASVQWQGPRPFREYVRRFHYDYLNYYPDTLRFLIKEVGADRIVVGTDLFAAKDVQYPNSFVEQLGIPAKDVDLILRGNARRLLQLQS